MPSADSPLDAITRQGNGVLVIGEALIDIVANAERAQPEEHVGGSPANVALALGRLGNPVRLLTALGRDARGERIARHLTDSGVVIDPRSWMLDRTSTARATIGTRWCGDLRLRHHVGARRSRPSRSRRRWSTSARSRRSFSPGRMPSAHRRARRWRCDRLVRPEHPPRSQR